MDVRGVLAAAAAGCTHTPGWSTLGQPQETPGWSRSLGESPAAVFRRLRLEMLAAERAALIGERDENRIDAEVLRSMLHNLELEEATLNRE